MSKPAAIDGAFADFKVIKTRSVVQLVVEIPIERADAALDALGGVPQPGAERRVAIARLVDAQKQERAPDNAKSLDAKERYASAGDMQKAVVRAALLCKDRAFQVYMACDDEGATAKRLCFNIGIRSRSVIGESPNAYHAFVALEQEFRATQQMQAYPDHWTGARA